MQRVEELQRLGLSAQEAQAYVALLRVGSLTAVETADEIGVSRTAVYPVLRSLADQGLIESGTGYGARFTPRPPEEALFELVEHHRQRFVEQARLAEQTVAELRKISAAASDGAPVAEILKDPRVIKDRFYSLQRRALRDVLVLVKAPILSTGTNEAQRESMDRGVVHRAIYEAAVLADERIAAHLTDWRAGQELARVYPGELPLKLAMFDRQSLLMPLDMRKSGRSPTLLLRSPTVAQGMYMLFESLWQESVDPVDWVAA